MSFAVGLKSLKQNSAAENIVPGDMVLVAGKRAGVVHYVGDTEFAPGLCMSVYICASVSDVCREYSIVYR